MSNTSVRKWIDEHMYDAQPIQANRDASGNIIPKVFLLSMTQDPLGTLAAANRIYKNGMPTYSLSDVSDAERKQALEDCLATHLQAPLENVKFHFFVEGVTRSFTHQMVRQRTANYAQESMRFAVKEHMAEEISLPPSLAALKEDDPRRVIWDNAIDTVSEAYNALVSSGIPAEDARGLAPHAITTRIHYITDLRNLMAHAGMRLCTQAQFEWRIVWLGIVKAIAEYTPDFSWMGRQQYTEDNGSFLRADAIAEWEQAHRWQFEALAHSGAFRPVCYQLGHCPMKASFDRSCTIRDRVDLLSSNGVQSRDWGMTIDNAEWLADPSAARKTSGGAGHE